MNSMALAPARTYRICVLAERLSGALDEGGRKFSYCLAKALEPLCEVQRISIGGEPGSNGSIRVPSSRTLANSATRRAVRDSQPDVICYAPAASLTTYSLARARVLRLAAPRARVVVLAFQPRKLGLIGRAFASRLRPDAVLALDNSTIRMARSLGIDSWLLPPAVDLDLFRSVGAQSRTALRRKFGLPEDEFIIIHVGHAKRERGLEALANVAPFAKVVFVAANSEGRDSGLVEELRSRGVIVVNEYVPAIHELYQAADCYLFPVFEPDAAIAAPLSVLEAMACNLPVLTTRYGALPDLFEEAPGYRYFGSPEDLPSAFRDRTWASTVQTREMVSPYTWENTAREFLQIVEGLR